MCYNVFIYILTTLRTMILASIQNMLRTGMNWTFYTEILYESENVNKKMT